MSVIKRHSRGSVVVPLTFAIVLFLKGAPAESAEKNGYQVNGFAGSFSTGVQIAVPPYHGVEPRISLSYSSEGRNGWVGMGWSLNGFSQILGKNEMYAHPSNGWPALLYLDGQELLACAPGSSYPSCASGGTHYTRNESYLKIVKADDANWTVYGKDGTRTKFTSLGFAGDYPWKLGQSQTVDTHGNTVNYTWWNPDGGVGHQYPSTATYNGYTVEFLYETRPDVISAPIRWTDTRVANRRLKTIKVRLSSGALIRAYKLGYTTAPQSGKSLLALVQQFGKDATFDAAGTVTGGTSLPPQTFGYTADGLANQLTYGAPVRGPVEEPVVFINPVGVSVSANSVSRSAAYTGLWDAGAVSRQFITSGDGYLEFTSTSGSTAVDLLVGFGNSDGSQDRNDIRWGVREAATTETRVWENGTKATITPRTVGDKFRVDVSGGVVRYKKNGTTFYTSTLPPTYPLRVDTSFLKAGTISDVKIQGLLSDMPTSYTCAGTLHTGDVNGDGRTDQICLMNNWPVTVNVSLGTATGFAAATTWASTNRTTQVNHAVGDFTGDGKTDLLAFSSDTWGGRYYVHPSTGTSFGAEADWGESMGLDPFYGTSERCNHTAHLGPVGDFNGDGRADITCIGTSGFASQDVPGVLFSYSTGAALSSVFGGSCGPNLTLRRLDWNADGADDVLCSSGGGDPEFSSVKANRPGYGIVDMVYRNGSFCTTGDYWAGDVNGDGRSDIGCKYGNVLMGGGYTNLANQGAFCVSGQTLIADLDGDGASEWICNNPGIGANDIQVRKWTGTGFGAATNWIGGFCAGTMQSGDFNGDGKTDLLCGMVAYGGTPALRGDLLNSVSNGIGGSTQVTYAPSTNYSSLNGASPKYVITSMSQNDGRGGVDVTTYGYENSYEDGVDRKWNGFSKVTTTHPKLITGGVLEAVAPVTVTGYNVVHGSAEGTVDWTSRQDGTGKVISYSKNTYLTTMGARQTALLQSVVSESYDGTTVACTTWPCGSGKRTKSEYLYDNYGNVTQVTNHGDFDAMGDETTTSTSYAVNTAAYIVGLPGKSSTYGGVGTSGALLGESRVSRDGNASWNLVPTKGDVTRTEAWLNTENRYTSSTTAYDAYGNATSSTDPTNKTVSATYDATYHVFPITASNAASESTSTTWDYLCAAPLNTTDPNGQVTTLTYDALCRPTGATAPLGAFQTRSYPNLGNAATQNVRVETPGPDGANDWSEAYFDGWGRTYLTAKRGPSAAKSILNATQFDARGNVSAQTAPYYADETAKITTFEYDQYNRQVKTTLPDGKTRLNSYPALSVDGFFQSTQTNELNQSSTTKFDVFGRVRKSEKYTALHGNLVTTSNYDILGRMTSLLDPAGNTWSYTYDSLGRNLTKNDPDAGNWSYTFDDASRVLTQTDAKSQTTTLTYDLIGRVSTKANPTETVTTTYSQARSGYFNAGRPTTVASSLGNGTLKFDYDALGRVTKQTRTLDGTNYTVQRNYDTAGYLRGMQYPDGDVIGLFGGAGTQLGYDQAGRLNSIPGILTSVTYNALGAPLVQTNANGTTTTKTYDANRFWLTDIDTTAPSLILQNLSYTLNDAGMATVVDSDIANEDWTYGYDELNRLTSSTNGVGANIQTWAYDSLGRFTSNSRVGTTFTYPSVGNVRPHAPTTISGGPLGTLNFTYDLNGNMATGNGRTYTWDANNLITRVVTSTKTTEFTYGPESDRIKKAEGSNVAKYPFGDDYEIDASGTVTKYFNAGFGVIAKKVGPTLYWLHPDRMGSINATTNNSGAEVLRRSYRSYGELLGQTGTHTESLDYIGQRTDAETGLTYLHARYYDSQLGMFVSPDPSDPLEEGVGTNRYLYGLGSPTWYRDPWGLSGSKEGGKDGGKDCKGGEAWSDTVNACVKVFSTGVDKKGDNGEEPLILPGQKPIPGLESGWKPGAKEQRQREERRLDREQGKRDRQDRDCATWNNMYGPNGTNGPGSPSGPVGGGTYVVRRGSVNKSFLAGANLGLGVGWFGGLGRGSGWVALVIFGYDVSDIFGQQPLGPEGVDFVPPPPPPPGCEVQ